MQMIFLSLQLAPRFGWHHLLWETSEWPKHGCALRKPSLPCVKQGTSETTAQEAGSSPLSLCQRAASPWQLCSAFWVLQSSCEGEMPLASPPGTLGSLAAANSLNLSCGWSRRGVETARLSHRNLIADVWVAR